MQLSLLSVVFPTYLTKSLTAEMPPKTIRLTARETVRLHTIFRVFNKDHFFDLL